MEHGRDGCPSARERLGCCSFDPEQSVMVQNPGKDHGLDPGQIIINPG